MQIVLPELISLQDFSLNLNNNKIDIKGANKLAKLLTATKLNSLNLNISGNEIKMEGAKCIIDSIKTMDLLKDLKLNIRNNNIKKGVAT